MTTEIPKVSGLPELPSDKELLIETTRLILEPIVESHTDELLELFSDRDLHTFVPFEPTTREELRVRCLKWASRRSPDGTEVWLNWLGREKKSRWVIAHFQAGIKLNLDSSIGYLVAKDHQKMGYASEGLESVFSFLHAKLGIREIKAWADTRNKASHQLCKKLGMNQVEYIKNADFFKGSPSDEFVFSKVFL